MTKQELLELIQIIPDDSSFIFAIQMPPTPGDIASAIKVMKGGKNADHILEVLPKKHDVEGEGLVLRRVDIGDGQYNISGQPFPDPIKGSNAFLDILRDGEIFKQLANFNNDPVVFLSKGATQKAVIMIGNPDDHIDLFEELLENEEVVQILFTAAQRRAKKDA